MLNIRIKTIPHSEQRYNTCGDYFVDEEGVMQFRISDLGDSIKELGILIHELIESFLCILRGIKWDDIDKFDKEFEANREEGDLSEPGNSPLAPYYGEHRFAENIERQLLHESGVDWFKYNDQIDSL